MVRGASADGGAFHAFRRASGLAAGRAGPAAGAADRHRSGDRRQPAHPAAGDRRRLAGPGSANRERAAADDPADRVRPAGPARSAPARLGDAGRVAGAAGPARSPPGPEPARPGARPARSPPGPARPTGALGEDPMTPTGKLPLTDEDAGTLDAYWRAANYLAAGQIYLMGNPLLAEPLRPEHIKPRLLGHWGTSPGLNFIWAHLNRAITVHGQPMMYVIGPGHGGPAALANSWLEGSYSEVYPSVPRDAAGMRELFRQFSFPGGVPSHVSPETPGSIHEGGELGYSLSHAHGAAFDNPDLIVACVVGDGEAETGPLATSWHANRFLNPARDGAVLP